MAGVYSYVARDLPILIDENPTIVLEANPNRIGFVLQNTQGILYVKFGAGCTPYNYSYRLPRSAVLEQQYQGILTACVASGATVCMITEII